MLKNIEVETRAFVSKTDYLRLKRYFDAQAKLIKKDHQITYYLTGKNDLRLQINNFDAKIWLKNGKIHQKAREEIEIRFAKNDFSKMKKLFAILGYKPYIRWDRLRYKYQFGQITVCLDDTKNYGKVLEMEKITTSKNKEKVLRLLQDTMKKLRIVQTSAKVFDDKYTKYIKKYRY